jgi:hypothetical protein
MRTTGCSLMQPVKKTEVQAKAIKERNKVIIVNPLKNDADKNTMGRG